jgi:hypothetical protein
MPWETYVRYLEEIERCHRALKKRQPVATLEKRAARDAVGGSDAKKDGQ